MVGLLYGLKRIKLVARHNSWWHAVSPRKIKRFKSLVTEDAELRGAHQQQVQAAQQHGLRQPATGQDRLSLNVEKSELTNKR
jgi:hypothetical protein